MLLISFLNLDPCDVFAWGSNFNYNLGMGNSQSKNAPEILEVFRKDFIDIKQVNGYESCKPSLQSYYFLFCKYNI